MAAGIAQFIRGQVFQTPALPTTDLTGRTIIVTGANTGLGLDAAKHLVRLHAGHVILACRNVDKGEAAKEEILASTTAGKRPTSKVDVWPLDLCSYSSVRAFASCCNAELDRLDAVIENAGVSLKEYTRAEDNETTITVNVISTFLLALLLLPKLRESARQYNIVPHMPIVGSAVHFWANDKQVTSPPAGQILASLNDATNADMAGRYYVSKLLVMQCIRELAAQIDASEKTKGKPLVVVSNVAPGFCKTELFRNEDSAGLKMGLRVIGRSSEAGSRTLVHSATAGRETHGQYLSESQVKSMSPFVTSEAGERAQKGLWEEVLAKLEAIQPGISENI